ncbi:hypothetical protein B0T19DRAFT_397180 [Cercophora scortea]|uniref:Protein kinase domain-containing protein n=1 Tax=Cercophora scortea TaxID=314031 RepID=A0AAE0J652_9PEZI|nr:hypothetical protein B0T19DRAFT_397180 [Cercophora scortea]
MAPSHLEPHPLGPRTNTKTNTTLRGLPWHRFSPSSSRQQPPRPMWHLLRDLVLPPPAARRAGEQTLPRRPVDTIPALFPTVTSSDLIQRSNCGRLNEDDFLAAIHRLPTRKIRNSLISAGGPGGDILKYSDTIAYKQLCTEREAFLIEKAAVRGLTPKLLCRLGRRADSDDDIRWQTRGVLLELADPFVISDLASPAGRLDASRQAAKLVSDLHALGIVHGDIKPDNLVISRNHNPSPNTDTDNKPPSLRVQLIDFAHAFIPDEDARRWRRGYSLGYVSPKRLREKALGRLLPPTEADDLFALAITIYQIWYGTDPRETIYTPVQEDDWCRWVDITSVIRDEGLLALVRPALEDGGVGVKD